MLANANGHSRLSESTQVAASAACLRFPAWRRQFPRSMHRTASARTASMRATGPDMSLAHRASTEICEGRITSGTKSADSNSSFITCSCPSEVSAISRDGRGSGRADARAAATEADAARGLGGVGDIQGEHSGPDEDAAEEPAANQRAWTCRRAARAREAHEVVAERAPPGALGRLCDPLGHPLLEVSHHVEGAPVRLALGP